MGFTALSEDLALRVGHGAAAERAPVASPGRYCAPELRLGRAQALGLPVLPAPCDLGIREGSVVLTLRAAVGVRRGLDWSSSRMKGATPETRLRGLEGPKKQARRITVAGCPQKCLTLGNHVDLVAKPVRYRETEALV